MGGGKGGSTQAPPPPSMAPAKENQEEIMMMMMSMMGSMAQPQTPELPPMPSLYTGPDVDWTEKNEELANKAKADYMSDAANKKGRKGTVLSSPLLDDDTPATSKSLSTGTKK